MKWVFNVDTSYQRWSMTRTRCCHHINVNAKSGKTSKGSTMQLDDEPYNVITYQRYWSCTRRLTLMIACTRFPRGFLLVRHPTRKNCLWFENPYHKMPIIRITLSLARTPVIWSVICTVLWSSHSSFQGKYYIMYTRITSYVNRSDIMEMTRQRITKKRHLERSIKPSKSQSYHWSSSHRYISW